MPDPVRPHFDIDDQIARYARGELTPQQARELAQSSLGDVELFEELTASALAKTTLENPAASGQFRAGPAKKSASSSRVLPRIWVPLGVALAASMAVAFFAVRERRDQSQLPPAPPRDTAAVSGLKPSLESSARPGQPILLASGLRLPAPAGSANIFRSPNVATRPPKQTGRIVSVDDGIASIDLGSLDGLGAGDQLRIVRDGRPTGTVVVTTVFRENAHARIIARDAIQVHDQVQLPDSTYLNALLERVNTLSRQGKIEEARAEAANTLRWAQASTVSARDLRNVLRQVADLEYHVGLSEAAEKYYQAVLETFGAGAEASSEDASEVLNNLAVLDLLRGDSASAEARLSQAFSSFLRPGLAFARLSNNRGVLAELRGDRKRAADLYTQSLNAFAALPGSVDERGLVETNLARIKSSR